MAIYNKKTVRDVDVEGKRVLVRVDFNTPLTPDCKVADDSRILGAMPTIRYLIQRKAKVILMSHLGRPKGEVDPRFSMRIPTTRLSQILGSSVFFSPECIGSVPKEMIERMSPGDVLVLENVRFHQEEEACDMTFASKLAELGDIFVNDAFGTAHRAHASTVGITKFLPSVAGLLVERELVVMGKALSNPDEPFVAIMGGAKVTDKIGVVQNLLKKVDCLLVGGGIAHTFLAAKGYNMGASRVNSDSIEWAKNLMEHPEVGQKLMLPEDLVVADAFDEDASNKVVGIDEVPVGWMALDIGPKTVEKFSHIIEDAKTVVWNGPMGVFEMKNFAYGTNSIAKAVAYSEGTSIIGGGDSIAAVEKAGLSCRVSHASTGGGSSLKFLEGAPLPAIDAIMDA